MSFLVSGRPRVEFNAHRVFAPEDIMKWMENKLFRLVRFDFIGDGGHLRRNCEPRKVAGAKFGCGIYTFDRSA